MRGEESRCGTIRLWLVPNDDGREQGSRGGFNSGHGLSWMSDRILIKTRMTDSKLDALAADVKRLTARVAALEKLLERIVRQKPVSEKQLERALRRVGVNASEASP
jgi:hypothetical protein